MSEERQELFLDHITNSYVDPTMALGLEEARFGAPIQSSDIELEPSLCDSQLWTFAGLAAMSGDGIGI